jgi:hypothetical protein
LAASAAVSVTARAGCDRARDGRGCGGSGGEPGRVQRARHGRGTGPSREAHGGGRAGHGSVPGPSPKCDAGARYARSRTVRNLRGSKSSSEVDLEPRRLFRGWKPLYGEGFQPCRFLTARIPRSPSRLPHQTITEVRLPHEPVPDVSRTPPVLGVSWRSQPERTAMRRPGPISDGRDRRAQRAAGGEAPAPTP